jgi:PPM family protein phosphatase
VGLRIAEHASRTDVGRQRHTNEDSYYAAPPVFAVADGMGGAQAGEVASQVAVDQFEQLRQDGPSTEEQLAEIARSGNRKIYEMAQADSRHAGMGTTLIAAVVGDHDVSVAHVGDSRLYLLRDGTLQQLTSDHSLVEEFVKQGRLTREQAERHPQRSVITRALGPEADVEVDTFSFPAKDGDVFLLCSDGLSTMLPDEEIRDILAHDVPLEEAGEALVAAANERGGRDNITVVLFRLEDDGRPVTRRTDTEDYETIAGGEQAPTPDEIEAERERHAAAQRASSQLAAGSRQTASRASPPRQLPTADLPTEMRPRPRAHPRRGRWLLRSAAAALVVLVLAVAALFAVTRSVWFLGTNDEGIVTLYRGLPYELPLGVRLYQTRYVSGVPALAIPPPRRKRVLDHQLRSRGDAVDLMRSVDREASR